MVKDRSMKGTLDFWKVMISDACGPAMLEKVDALSKRMEYVLNFITVFQPLEQKGSNMSLVLLVTVSSSSRLCFLWG